MWISIENFIFNENDKLCNGRKLERLVWYRCPTSSFVGFEN